MLLLLLWLVITIIGQHYTAFHRVVVTTTIVTIHLMIGTGNIRIDNIYLFDRWVKVERQGLVRGYNGATSLCFLS